MRDVVEDDRAFRETVRDWLRANAPKEQLASGDTPNGFAQHIEWEKKLAEASYSVVSWPRRFGGLDVNLWQWLIFEEEYYKANAPTRVTQNGIFLLAPSLFRFGTDDQKERYLRPMARAEHVWAQGWSEPGAGSDLASVRSTAVRDDERGGWLVSGQKTWTTRGAYCTHLFGLFRTDPNAQKHRGLTYLLIDLSSDGVTVRPFERLDGDPGFAEVFFDNVFVPDQDVLGGVNNGWKVAMSATSSERGLTLRSPGRFLKAADDLVRLFRQAPPESRALNLESVVSIWCEAQAYNRLTHNQVALLLDGGDLGSSPSVNKVFWSELDIRIHETARSLLGVGSYIADDWMRGFLFSLSGPIYAGTNEIQRNIIAERILGLPR
ncbi:acyl-CoA dehydrogenase family protein [Brevibacterium luteolum]|uniref:Acyl-CoA dehydrogenase n=1 Tax=Brevibacterium luteolum TaxID=199591 RepID=A0A2N6PHD0_9MICO|nr:acyl-CoA dehydrogenase family protein [Brevibacterium luteolum]PMB98094.1 acyl-CoA dehydrogenase [Brevibacterium luteolum]